MNIVPIWFRKWIKNRAEKSNHIQRLAAFLYQKGFIKAIAQKFVQVHLDNPRRRRRLFGVWISHQYFMTYPWQFYNLVNTKQIPLDLFYGKKDPIILAKWGKNVARKIPHSRLHLLECKHKIINRKLVESLSKLV